MIRSVVLLIYILTWHIYRIVTLRPAYEHLRGTMTTYGLFIGAYLLVGGLRISLIESKAPASEEVLSLLLWFGLVQVVFAAKDHSNILFSAILGATTGANLLSLIAHGVGYTAPIMFISWVEAAAIVNAVVKFRKLPVQLQQPNHQGKG